MLDFRVGLPYFVRWNRTCKQTRARHACGCVMACVILECAGLVFANFIYALGPNAILKARRSAMVCGWHSQRVTVRRRLFALPQIIRRWASAAGNDPLSSMGRY